MPPQLPRHYQEEAFDAADPEQVAAREAAVKLREEQRRAVESALMSTTQGREWVWQVLSDCHAWDERIAVTANAYEQGFWSGQREIGLQLMRRVARSSPDNFSRMLTECDK